MIARLVILLAAAGLVCLPLAAAPLPLQAGEQLNYRVSWTVVPGAGEIKVAAANDPAAAGRLLVTTTTTTRRLAKLLLPFEARAESTFDLATGKLLALQERSATRGKQQEHSVAFDYAARLATYTKTQPPQPPRGYHPIHSWFVPIELHDTVTITPLATDQPSRHVVEWADDAPRPSPIDWPLEKDLAVRAHRLLEPEGDPADLIMALLQTRTWNLQPGEKRDALVLFDDDFYELTLYALRFEKLRTGLGEFNTLVLEPRMEKVPPKGMFKRGSTVRVWIAQDERRLPVRFEVEFKIGTGTATLDSYQPPASNTPAPAAAPGAAVPDAPRAGS